MAGSHQRPKVSPDVQLSKSLSWLLRHGAQKQSLQLDDGGFVDINEILRLKQFRKYSLDDILRVVENNDKKRFTIRPGSEAGELRIRANQGHSLPVSDEHLLIPLTSDTVPPLLYHGTYANKIDNIRKFGLHRMNRNHIHFAEGLPGEHNVISGIRKNCNMYIIVDSQKAMKEGLKFYRSDNGVILTRGNDEGYVLPSCFVSIEPISHRRESRKQLETGIDNSNV